MPISASQSLQTTIYNQTDNRFFVRRLFSSLKAIGQEKGYVKGGVTTAALTAASVYTLAFSYFLLEGSVRSLIDVHNDHSIVGLRPIGDAGGWIGLSVFSVMALRDIYIKVIREGEYIRLKSICQQWLKDNKNWIQKHPEFYDQLYVKISDQLDTFQSQCLFSKSLVSRRFIILDIFQKTNSEIQELDVKKRPSEVQELDVEAQLSEVQELDVEAQSSELSFQSELDSELDKDRKLQNIFLKIKTEMNDISSSKQYCRNIYEGQKSIRQGGGCFKQLEAVTLGIAIPILLLSCAIFSFIGEFGLGKELFIDREELTDVGHFGEWPFNAVELIGIAFFLHLWCIINPGNFAMTRNIYAKHIECTEKNCSVHKSIQEDTRLHHRLCTLANAELSQKSSQCGYFQSLLNYKFEAL